MHPLDQAAALLAEPSPDVTETPARIEELNLCAYAVTEHITSLQDEAGRHEEAATAGASAESNDAKRKARRAELLRADDGYNAVRAEIQAADSYRVRLDERAARLRREFRLELIRLERSTNV